MYQLPVVSMTLIILGLPTVSAARAWGE